MDNDGQSYIPMAATEHSLNTNRSICTSLDKYASLIDTIRGYFVQSLETRICNGLEMFVANDETNLSTQFVPYVKKCLDVAGNALKYFFKDGIIPCVLNTIILNNRLNRVSRNLDELGVHRNFLRHINVYSYIYANEYWIKYDDNNENHCNCNNKESLTFKSSHATNNSCQHGDKSKSTKNSRRPTEDTHQHFDSVVTQKMNHPNPSINSTGKVHNNSNDNSHHKSLQVVVRNRDNNKMYHMMELPCNYERFIHQIAPLIDSSWKITDTSELNHEFVSTINNTCNTINEKLDELDIISIMRCRLYFNIQDDCIYVQLKMMDTNGSKIFLHDDKICHKGNTGRKLNLGRSDKVMSGIPATIINSNTVVERVSSEVRGGANGLTSTRSSFRTINEYPRSQVNSPRNSYPIDNSSAINYDDEDDSDESDDYEGYDGHTNCSCTSENYCWGHEWDCRCNSLSGESFDGERNFLESKLEAAQSEASTTASYKSFVNLISSTHANDDLQKTPAVEMFGNGESSPSRQIFNESSEVIQENNAARDNGVVLRSSRITGAVEEIFDLGLKRDLRESRKSKSVSIQTADFSENLSNQRMLDDTATYRRESSSTEMSEGVSIVISDASQSQEIVGLERIDEIEEIDETHDVAEAELIEIVGDIDDKQRMEETEVVGIAGSVQIDEDKIEKYAVEDKNIETVAMVKEVEVYEMEKCQVPTGKSGKIDDAEKQVGGGVVVDSKKSEVIEKVEDFQEQEETISFECLRESGTQTCTGIIDESIVSIRNEVSEFMKDLVTSFVRGIDLSVSAPPPPPSPESSKQCSSIKSGEIQKGLASLSCDGIKKIRRVSTKEKLIVSPDSERRQGSSTIFVSPCRHSRKSSGSLRIIKCPRKLSGSISNRYSCSETFSDAQAFHDSPSFYAAGDSSMNNLYTVYPHEWKSRICQCKKYKKSRVKTTVHITKKGIKYLSKRFDHYYPTIKKNTKLFMAALRKHFNIVFSRKTYYKIKFFMEEKLNKIHMERETAANESRNHVCRMQHRRKSSSSNHSFNNFSRHANNNNFTRYESNYLINSDKSDFRSHSSLSPNINSQTRFNNSHHFEVCTNRDSELDRYRHRRLSDFLNDNQTRRMNNKLINNAGQFCRCCCCCDSIETINYYQSTDNSIHSDKCHRFSFNNKHTQHRNSREYSNHKKAEGTRSIASSLSLSSGQDYFCWYHKMFAAKYFNRYPMSDSSYTRHRSISDELEVDCGECFGPTDHNFRLMLNQYISFRKKIQCPVINRQSINGNSSRAKTRHE